MFGFLRASANHRRWRQAYARVCRHQHVSAGVSTLPLLSYEGVFTYVLAQDLGWCPGLPHDSPGCCRLRTSGCDLQADDARFAEFAMHVGLLLLSVKLDDDIRDDRSWSARLARWWFRRPLARNRSYFHQLQPGLLNDLEDSIETHLRLEQSSAAGDIETYSAPTGAAFAKLFASQQHLVEAPSSTATELSGMIGDMIGRAIVAFDAAVDWHRDRDQSRFNPLQSEAQVDESLEYAARCLSHAAWGIQRVVPDAASIGILHHACRRILDRPASRSPRWRQRLRDWGLHRQPGYVLARMDCCDAGCCEAGCNCSGLDCAGAECCGAEAAASGESVAGCGHCCAGGLLESTICCCDCPGCAAGSSRNRHGRLQADPQETLDQDPAGSTSRSPRYESLVGLRGITRGPLSPSGLIEIDGQRIPAESEVGWINPNEPVQIIEGTAAGVRVRPVVATDEQEGLR